MYRPTYILNKLVNKKSILSRNTAMLPHLTGTHVYHEIIYIHARTILHDSF